MKCITDFEDCLRPHSLLPQFCGGDGLWIIVGLIVVFGGVIGLAELTGIPLENWSTGIILLVMFLLFLLFGVIILLFY